MPLEALVNPPDPLAGLGSNPDGYRLPDGNVAIQFSGGRSSAYMLRQILNAYDGILPSQAVVLFQNTGAEHPATLDFVEECSQQWEVPIVWLELAFSEKRPKWRHKVVDYTTASRDCEPFETLLSQKVMLPNPTVRYCTVELKIKTVERYLVRERGWPAWTNAIGIRGDESRRVMRIRTRPCGGRAKHWLPLAVNGVSETEVLRYWQSAAFDLSAEVGVFGNCMGCFHKTPAKKRKLMQEYPEAAKWWESMEQKTGTQWRKDHSWADLRVETNNSSNSSTELEGFCDICGD